VLKHLLVDRMTLLVFVDRMTLLVYVDRLEYFWSMLTDWNTFGLC
jgi:hypothetical protein